MQNGEGGGGEEEEEEGEGKKERADNIGFPVSI